MCNDRQNLIVIVIKSDRSINNFALQTAKYAISTLHIQQRYSDRLIPVTN